jgi:hypothetical protein
MLSVVIFRARHVVMTMGLIMSFLGNASASVTIAAERAVPSGTPPRRPVHVAREPADRANHAARSRPRIYGLALPPQESIKRRLSEPGSNTNASI